MSADAGGRAFPKAERLCSRRVFDLIFTHRRSCRSGSLRCIYAFDVPTDWVKAPVSMAVTVPKHLFKRAVRRNLLKRRIREAYRLHKAPLIEYMQHLGRTLALVIKYENKTPDTFALIEGDMLRIFRKLMYEARQLPPAA